MIFSRDHARKGDLEYQKGNLKRAAELYLKAKRLDQAADVFAELGKIEKAVAVYLEAGDPLKAAQLLDGQGRYKEAIASFEQAGAYAQAAESCLRAHQLVRAGRFYERARMYRRAAETFAKAREIEHELRAWAAESRNLRDQRTGEKDLGLEKKIREVDVYRAERLAEIGNPLEAAELYLEHGLASRAAPLFERARSYARAAESYLAAGRAADALAAVDKAPDAGDELRAEIYLNCARHEEAGAIFERMGRFDAAASAYEGGEDWLRAAKLWERADAPARAAEFFLQLDRFEDAGRCFAKADQHDRAAEAFARAGNDLAAADAYVALGDPLRASDHYRKAGHHTAARDLLQEIDPESAFHVEACRRLLPLLVEDKRFEAAEEQIGFLSRAGSLPSHELLYWSGRLEERRGHYRAAETAYRQVTAQAHDFRDAARRLREVRAKISDSAVDLPAHGSASSPAAPRRPTTSVGLEPLPEPATETPPLSSYADATALPFDFESRIDPWWSGAEFFRARDRRTKREILLVSFPLAEIGDRAAELRPVVAEVSALRHPAILNLDELVLASDKILLLYEFFEGRTLDGLLAAERLPPLGSLNLIAQLNEALITAHKVGLSHQWLSPRTLLVDAGGRIKLVGIGLRRFLAERDATSRAYLSPEVHGGGRAGPASDVYSLGQLAVLLLDAEMPVGWTERAEIDHAAVGWPREVEEAVARPIRQILIRALARDPLARPSTAELQAALSSVGLLPGQILANRYEITGELGRGGMSRVYKARDRELDDEVAIKTVLAPALGHSENEERLLREVQICRKISHPNVVRVHDFGRFPGGIFVIMEMLDGPGLDRIIAREAPLPLARVKKLMSEIAAALDEAHRLRVIHRDLKPSNVILAGGRVKVLDFGIARMGDGAGGPHLTRTGEVIGSPMYMAPEQIQGQPLSGSCDLYALGVISYALLCGKEPFLGETTTAIVLKHLHEPPPDIRQHRPDLPRPWCEMLTKLLLKKPSERYQTAAELLETLSGLPT